MIKRILEYKRYQQLEPPQYDARIKPGIEELFIADGKEISREEFERMQRAFCLLKKISKTENRQAWYDPELEFPVSMKIKEERIIQYGFMTQT